MNIEEFTSWLMPFASDDGTYPPVMADLFSLYSIVKTEKVVNILEFGSGYSTLVFAKAIDENQLGFGEKYLQAIAFPKEFEIETIDASRKYSHLTKSRIPKQLQQRINFRISRPRIVLHQNTPVMSFPASPTINPDLIYIDGPNPDQVSRTRKTYFRGSRNGKSKNSLPIAVDVLSLEYYLQPGTIIIVDGRGANAEFLKLNLKRTWKYNYLIATDQHIFQLISPSWGPRNTAELNFRQGKS